MMRVIKLLQINKKFKSKEALKNINVNFDNKKVYGLLGPNGSGKTTLFNIIAGFLDSDNGEIFLDDINLTKVSLSKRSELGISYLPQEASIFREMTVYDNILCIAQLFYNTKKSISVTDKLIDQFSLSGFLNTKGKFLSGGERRRTEIARALASNPAFLLLDEPFAGIDPIAIDEVKSTINFLKNIGVGVIITDHNVREALNIVDYSYIIYNGEIIKSGNPKEITSDNFVKKIYLGENYN